MKVSIADYEEVENYILKANEVYEYRFGKKADMVYIAIGSLAENQTLPEFIKKYETWAHECAKGGF